MNVNISLGGGGGGGCGRLGCSLATMSSQPPFSVFSGSAPEINP